VKERLQTNLVRLLLPLAFSSLLLVILFCGLAKVTGAEPGGPSPAMSRGGIRYDLLGYQTSVSVCQQTENLVPNQGFEWGIGWSNHWYHQGNCTFEADVPGHNGSAIAARIHAGRNITSDCEFYTAPLYEIRVESGKHYDYSAWVKSDFVKGIGSARLCISFQECDVDGSNCEPVGGGGCTRSVTDTQSVWVPVADSVLVPAQAEYAVVEAVLARSSEGSVWFDDVFLGLAICLDISKSGYPDRVSPGQMLTYTIVYSNTGREKATAVQVIEPDYDEHVVFTDAEPDPSFGTENVWYIPTLLPGASGVITVWVQVQECSWLFNNVLVFSSETLANPVYATASTACTPDGPICAVSIFLPSDEKFGEYGYLTDYDLRLGNAGSCDGVAQLATASSQGWPITVKPSSPYTLPSGSSQDLKVAVGVPRDVLNGITDVTSITATLVCGLPCTKAVTRTTAITTTSVSPWHARLCLPLVLRCWPPTPALYPIGNDDINGSYDVCWHYCGNNVTPPGSYSVLEEDTDINFPSPTVVYSGTDTCVSISGRDAGQYYYRVEARGSWGRSGWSNKESVGTWWEREPNNSCPNQVNGPIVSGVTYAGTFTSTTDLKDYFYFTMTNSHSIDLWLTDIPSGCDYDLALRDATCALVDEYYSNKPGNANEYVHTAALPAGRYHIQAYYYTPGCLQPYHLRAVYQ